MVENLVGLVKIIGISVLLVALWIVLAILVPESFLSTNNVENLLRRTALYGILGIGVAYVIITSGIDLAIGSLVCLCACLFALFLNVDYQPYQQSSVWKISTAGTAIVAKSQDFKVGETVHYYGGRRARDVIAAVTQIREIDYQGRSAWEITLAQPFTRDDEADREQPQIGYLALMSPIARVVPNEAGSTLQFSNEAQQLRPRDRVWLMHPTRGRVDGVINSVERKGDAIEFLTEAGLANVDTEWLAIAVERRPRMSVPLAVLSVLGIAGGLGLVHALLITKLNQQPFVVTLCGLMIYRGLARKFSNDQTLGGFGSEYADSLGFLATGKWVLWQSDTGTQTFGIPYVFFILIFVAVAAAVLLNLTIWGRYLLATGKNQEAAKYSGINTHRIIILAYVLCALLTGLGGILHGIDANSISPSSFGNFFELYAIAAAVLGGCSLRGGEGSIMGVVIGTALMQTLNNSIVLLKIPDELEFVIIGGVILLGSVSDELIRRLASRFRSNKVRV